MNDCYPQKCGTEPGLSASFLLYIQTPHDKIKRFANSPDKALSLKTLSH